MGDDDGSGHPRVDLGFPPGAALGTDGDLALLDAVINDFNTGKIPDWRKFLQDVISTVASRHKYGDGTPKKGVASHRRQSYSLDAVALSLLRVSTPRS